MAVVLAWVAPALQEQQGKPEHPFEPGRLERVVVMGASLSAGFGAERPFTAVLEASLRARHKPILDLGDELFFTSPLAIGPRQVSTALDADPTLVVAIDFLFWYGYGTIDSKGGAIELESERLELLERGLELLEDFECPLIVGDFPDMSAAVGKMLSPGQMPQKTTLPLLSRRVREWAAGREHVLVLSLADLAAKLATTKEIQIGKYTFPAGTRLLQRDQLHPTVEGLVAVSQLAFEQLIAARLARAQDFELDPPAVLAKLRPTSALTPAGAPAGPR